MLIITYCDCVSCATLGSGLRKITSFANLVEFSSIVISQIDTCATEIQNKYTCAPEARARASHALGVPVTSNSTVTQHVSRACISATRTRISCVTYCQSKQHGSPARPKPAHTRGRGRRAAQTKNTNGNDFAPALKKKRARGQSRRQE